MKNTSISVVDGAKDVVTHQITLERLIEGFITPGDN